MQILDCIAAVARPLHDFGDEFMSDETTAAVGLRAGFPAGRGFYCRGRFGVLGEAPVPVVQAVQGFLGPDLITAGWLAGRPVMPAEEAAACYAEAVREWGRAHIPGRDHGVCSARAGNRRAAGRRRRSLGCSESARLLDDSIISCWS